MPKKRVIEHTRRFIEYLLSDTRINGGVIVLAPEDWSLTEAAELLESPRVSGVIARQAPTEPSLDSRLGWITGQQFIIPDTSSRYLLAVDSARPLSVMRSLFALRRGVRYFLILDPQLNLVKTHILGWALRRAWNNFYAGLPLIAGTVSRVFASKQTGHIERRLRVIADDSQHPNGGFFDATQVTLFNNSLAAGGAERQLVNTALGLANNGVLVNIRCRFLQGTYYTFYLPLVDGEVVAETLRPLADIVGGLSPEDAALLKSQIAGLSLQRFERILMPWKVELIVIYAANLLTGGSGVAHFWQDDTNVLGGLAAYLCGVPRIILGTRNMAPYRFPYHQPYMAPIYRFLLQKENVRLINNSDAGARDYAQWLGIDRDRVITLRNGVRGMTRPAHQDLEAWQIKKGMANNGKVVGSVFRFSAEKEPELWIDTAAIVAQHLTDVTFLLVGEGALENQIRARAKRHGIDERLYMPGNEPDVRLALGQMDVFLMTSSLEGTPNVCIEAQQLGVPVVTTVAGGSGETIIDGRTGWLVPTRDAHDLAKAVIRALTDRSWHDCASSQAIAFSRETFGVDRMIAETKEIYFQG